MIDMGVISTALRIKKLYEDTERLSPEKLAQAATLSVQGFAEEKSRQVGERILGGFTGYIPYGNYVNQKVREYATPNLVETAIRYSLKGYNGGMTIERKRYGEITDHEGKVVKGNDDTPAVAYFYKNHIQITAGEDMEKALGADIHKAIRESNPDVDETTLQKYFEKYQIAHERGEKIAVAILKRDLTGRDHAFYESELFNSLKTIAEYDKEAAQIYRTIALPIYQARQKAGQAPLVMPAHDKYLN